ncbi:MAG: hypothetical protein OHK005_14090 [Candidatus Methylacidiphilales bacterium]
MKILCFPTMSASNVTLVILLSFFLMPAVALASPGSVAYVDGPGIAFADSGGTILKVTPAVWGPDWAFTSMKGEIAGESGQPSKGRFSGKLAKTNTPFTLDVVLQKQAEQILLSYTVRFPEATQLTLFVIEVQFSPRLNGSGIHFISGGEAKEDVLPLEKRGLGPSVSEIRLPLPPDEKIRLDLQPPADVASDNALRIVLVKDHAPAGSEYTQTLALTLPPETRFFASPEEVPLPDNWSKWYEWQGNGQIPEESVLNLETWLDAPAGKHGRIVRKGDELFRAGKPTKFWGINVCFAATAPDKGLAERRAKRYAAHGINAVRLHKYADGHGWAGILSKESFLEFDPVKLDRMDYFIAKLKEKGIYIKLSPTFGTFKLGPADRERIPFMDEFGSGPNVTTPPGGAYLSKEIGDLQIEQTVQLLRHKNPHTGLTYAEDPAIMVVELLNEQSALFFTTMNTLKSSPTLRRMASNAFTDWLLKRYGSVEAILARWGSGGLNTFADEGFTGESFEEKTVVPVGNPWFFDPEQLDGSQAHRKPRLLDTMLFLYELQNDYYRRFVEAIRQTGYTGEIVASNWQAGRAFSHYYNLHSDAQVGIVDRHNYFKGKTPMLARPGSGMLSTGMQQVAGHPFMLSEWIHVYPTRFPSEGVAIIAAYGMGLQGWDVSYLFQNKDDGRYEPRLGTEPWVVAQPEVLGLFPAVARQVLRQDIKTSEVTAIRSVHLPSLHEGKLGFNDQVRQGYDDKSFESSTVPAEALAAVRSLVSFDDNFKETPAFDLTPYQKDGAIVSSTGQLTWHPAPSSGDGGFFTIDTPATQAVVGFAAGRAHALTDVTLETETPYAAIYLTASEPDKTLATSRRMVLVAMGRTLNDEMRYVGAQKVQDGNSPIKMEPVRASIQLNRFGAVKVHVLDHNGKRTGQTISVQNGKFEVNGAVTKTPYYEIAFD